MYKKNHLQKSGIIYSKSYKGESLETKIQKLLSNKEPIEDSSPLIYTDRQEGIQAAYDIRTDRFEVAVEAMDKVQQMHITNRELKLGERTYDTMSNEQQEAFNKKHPKNVHAVKMAAQQNNREGGA